MGYIKQIFSGARGEASSKRVAGAICILYAMGMCTLSYIIEEKDISPNVQVISLQFLLAGVGLLGAGLLEKPNNEKV